MSKIPVTLTISIDSDELNEKFVRSSGPGGQNVNKVSTAVQLRFDVRNSSNLSERIKQKILNSGDSRLTKEGELIIIAESKRTQETNRKDAIERLKQIIRTAAIVQKPRIPTKPSRSSIKRRLDGKSRRSETKQKRSGKINLD